MQYRKMKDGTEVSILGFGCMRLPRSGPAYDYKECEKEIVYAVENGVNYFDTAYMYPGNEEILGKILKANNLRDKVLIATKLPQYIIKKASDIDRYFNEELKRLQTGHIDYYIMHMLADVDRWETLKSFGITEWLEEKKASGMIRNIGFSFHGDSDNFIRLIDAYDWDFCQIQYNYMDENSQAGRRGLEYSASKGIPVVIMEPLRGGRLVKSIPQAARKLMETYPKKYSAAEWALRWLLEQEDVTCVLSGINSMDVLKENIRIASEVKPNEFTDDERRMIEGIKNEIRKSDKVGCTACRYCMPCPKGVDIPGTFACYNSMYSESKFQSRANYLMNTSFRGKAGDYTKCVDCGLCEKHCPQHIKIREELKTAGKELTPFYFKIAKKLIGKFIV